MILLCDGNPGRGCWICGPTCGLASRYWRSCVRAIQLRISRTGFRSHPLLSRCRCGAGFRAGRARAAVVR
jgi:hypothetical protein